MIKGLIISFIIFIFTFFIPGSDLQQKAFLFIPLLFLFIATGIDYWRKFFGKLIIFKIGYYFQISILLIIFIYLIILKFLPDHNSMFLLFLLVSVSIITFIITIFIPLIKYWQGLKVYYPKKFRVPFNGRKIEISIKNFIPLNQHIKLEFSLPSNVEFKGNGKGSIKKIIQIKPLNKINLRWYLKSIKNREEKIATLILKEDSNIKKVYQIKIIT